MLRPGVVVRGLQVLAENPGAGALTVRIENTDGSEQRGGRRNLMTPWSGIVEQSSLERLMPDDQHFQRLHPNDTGATTEGTAVTSNSGTHLRPPRAAYD